jgi:hypothetical protein
MADLPALWEKTAETGLAGWSEPFFAAGERFSAALSARSF